MPIDLNCVSDRLVHRLAELCDADTLSLLEDKKDKLLPKLYKRRLEIDFRHRQCEGESKAKARRRASVGRNGTADCKPFTSPIVSPPDSVALPSPPPPLWSSSRVLRCRNCAALYPDWAQRLLTCAESPCSIDARGELTSQHVPVAERWSLTEHVGNLHADGMTWEEIYWLMWGVTHVFRCKTCEAWFPADCVDGCAYHEEQAPDFSRGSRGTYSCCGAHCRRFSPYAASSGCKTKEYECATQ